MIDKSTYSILNGALSTSLNPSSKEQLREIASTIDAESLQSNIKQLTSMLRDPSYIEGHRNSIRSFFRELASPGWTSDIFHNIKAQKQKFYSLNKSNYTITFILNLFQKELDKRASESSTNSDNLLWALPGDMILNILLYLNIQDIAQLSQTSLQADQFLERNETKRFLTQRLSTRHRIELNPNYTNLPPRAFLNWLRIATSNVANNLNSDYEPILYQPENFVDYLSFSADAKFNNKLPEHQLRLGLLCRNENAVATALKTIEWNDWLTADAACFDSWNILNNYYLIENELNDTIMNYAILSGDSEIFDYAINHWHLPPEFDVNSATVGCAISSGNLIMLDKVSNHPITNFNFVVNQNNLGTAAGSGQIDMFTKILNHPQKSTGVAILQGTLNYAAQSGNIEMVNLILAHPNKSPDVTIKQSTLRCAALSGQTEIFDKILDHPTLSETLTVDQDILDAAARSGQVRMFNKIYHHPKKDSALEIQKITLANAIESGQIEMFNLVTNHREDSFDLTVYDLVHRHRLDYDMFVTICEKLNPDPSVISEFLKFKFGTFECFSESIKKYAENYILQFHENIRATTSLNR